MTKATRPNRPALRAFTMIEILVVVAILAIGSGIALYGYASYRNSLGVNMSANTVQRMLMQGRNRAINLNKVQQVFVDLDNNLVWIDELECVSVPNPDFPCTDAQIEFCKLTLDDPCCEDISVECLDPQPTDCCMTERVRTSMVVDQEPMAEDVIIAELIVGQGQTPETSGVHAITFYPDGRAPFVIMNLRREADNPADDENFTAVRLFPASGEAQILEETKLP